MLANTPGTPGAGELTAALRAAVADADGYYMLTYRSKHVEDGKFHPVDVRVKRPRVQLRARSGYWAASANDRFAAELLARPSGPSAIRLEPPRRISPLIQPWFGLALGSDGKTRVTFVWEPSTAVPGDRVRRPTAARLELTVLGAGDDVIFQGPVLPTGPGVGGRGGGEGAPARPSCGCASSGRLASAARCRHAYLSPRLARQRSDPHANSRAQHASSALDNARAVPVSSRQFGRTERLLIRFRPRPTGNGVSRHAAATGWQPMRTLDVRLAADGETGIDIARRARVGEYQLELAASPAGRTRKSSDSGNES